MLTQAPPRGATVDERFGYILLWHVLEPLNQECVVSYFFGPFPCSPPDVAAIEQRTGYVAHRSVPHLLDDSLIIGKFTLDTAFPAERGTAVHECDSHVIDRCVW